MESHVQKERHTQVIITKSLNDLWNEKEGELNWMLSQNSMSILQDQRITVESPFEECIGDDGWNRRPQE